MESKPLRLWQSAAPAAAAGGLLMAFAWLAFLPHSLGLFTRWTAWFEDPSNAYRVWWFWQVLSGAREGSIWFMPDLLWPHGIPTVQTSNGIGKELLVALLGGAAAPWLAMNLITVTTPATVGLCAFLVLRQEFRGRAFWPALLGGWMAGWTSQFLGSFVSPWTASMEGLVLFLGALLLLRRRFAWSTAAGAGVAAGASAWLQLQSLVYLVPLAVIFALDCVRRRDGRGVLGLLLAGGIGFVLALPLLYQTMVAFGWSTKGMGGDFPAADALSYRARLSTLFVPPDPFRHPLFPTENLLGRLGAGVTAAIPDLRPSGFDYLGVFVLLLAGVGVASRRRGTGFLAAVAGTFLLLGLGPVLSVGWEPTAVGSVFGPTWIPGPFLALRDLPLFSSMRTPGRFLLIAQIALGMLAGFGLLSVLRARALRGRRRWGAPVLALMLAGLHGFDVRLPLNFSPAQYTPFWEQIAREPGRFTVLDVPYKRGMHQYMHYAAYHGHRIPWGFGSRVPGAAFAPIEEDLRFPLVVTQFPEEWPTDYGRFAQSLARYRVRYIVLHELHLRYNPAMEALRARLIEILEAPATWTDQPWIQPPLLVHQDAVVRVYRVAWQDPLPPEAPAR